jgi:radical SAM protein with 4Fe4S-binding SPASM domain
MMFAGEGEPLLHPSCIQMIITAKMHDIDTALTTNGTLLDYVRRINVLPFLDWMRISLDAANEETYRHIHRGRVSFETVTTNIRETVKWRDDMRCDCTIGVQALVIPQNFDELADICWLAKDMGVDYVIFKPYSQHPYSRHKFDIHYETYQHMKENLEKWGDENFKVIVRDHAMSKLADERPYKKCLGLPFMSYIACNGDVYACSAFLGNTDYIFGNIYEDCFPAIWESERRKEVMAMIDAHGVEPCREICRMDEINRYLWQLKYDPPAHLNFI